MELFSDSTCCSHAWACYPTEMRYLVVTYMKSERTWTIPMPLTWILYIFLMADDWPGSLIEIYIGLPRVFNAFLRFYFLNTTILQIYWVTKSASNVYRRRDVQLFSKARSMFQFLPSRTQLVEEHLLCLSLSRLERFSASLVCNVLPILSRWFLPLLEYFCWQMRS